MAILNRLTASEFQKLDDEVKANGYSNLSDDEIDTYIEARSNYTPDWTKLDNAADGLNSIADSNEQLYTNANAQLQSLIASTLALEEISY